VTTPQEFGRAALFIEGDDSQLRATLTNDEALTRRSADKMQANLQPLVIGQQAVGQSAGAASAAVGVLGAAATATGSQALATTAQIGGMGSAIAQMGNAALAGAAGIKAMAVASAAFLATGLGLALAGLAAVVGILAFAWRSHNRELAEANRLNEEAKSANLALAANLDTQNKALQRRLQLLRGADPTALDIGAARQELEPARAALAAALVAGSGVKEADEVLDKVKDKLETLRQIQRQEDLNRLANQEEARRIAGETAALARRQAAQATEAARQESLRTLQREIEILQGVAIATDFIADEELRRKTILRDTLALEKQRADAFAARVGPQTVSDAARLVANELKVLKAREQGSKVLGVTLRQMLAIGKITQQQFETLQKTVGLQKAQISFGPAALQTFRQVSLSRTTLGGPGAKATQPVKDAAALAQLKKIQSAINRGQVPRAAP